MNNEEFQKFLDAVRVAIKPALESPLGSPEHVAAFGVAYVLDDVRALLPVRSPGWIAVSERLPERLPERDMSARVLIFTERLNVYAAWLGYRDGLPEWICGDRSYGDGVTHWMPVPDGPEDTK